jgi:hypothetical protein
LVPLGVNQANFARPDAVVDPEVSPVESGDAASLLPSSPLAARSSSWSRDAKKADVGKRPPLAVDRPERTLFLGAWAALRSVVGWGPASPASLFVGAP